MYNMWFSCCDEVNFFSCIVLRVEIMVVLGYSLLGVLGAGNCASYNNDERAGVQGTPEISFIVSISINYPYYVKPSLGAPCNKGRVDPSPSFLM